MISATEANIMTRKAKFANSAYARLAEVTISESASCGESETDILIPLEIVPDMVEFLTDNGYECIVTGAITGAMVNAAW